MVLNNNNRISDVLRSFRVDGVDIVDKKLIVEKFNDYFVNIGNTLASSIPSTPKVFSEYLKSPNPCSLALYPVNATEVMSIVSQIQSKWSAGFDCIPTNVMKFSIIHTAEPISRIINKSFSTGIFPEKLKIAKICPIFKNGEKCLFSNYRPISILPCFSKIFEKQCLIV